MKEKIIEKILERKIEFESHALDCFMSTLQEYSIDLYYFIEKYRENDVIEVLTDEQEDYLYELFDDALKELQRMEEAKTNGLNLYQIPVYWKMYGIVEVKARSLEEAKRMIYDGEVDPPEDGYVMSLTIDENPD